MKSKFIFPVLVLSIASLGIISCGKEKPPISQNNEVVTSKEGKAYTLDTENSKIEWKGFKVLKSENTSHFGTIKFEKGEVTVKDGILESGNFVANMVSLENVDLKDDADQKAKLEDHLKSGDFFEVEKYPTATYEITKVTAAKQGSDYNTVIDGNLTIKGITKPTQFNANVSVNDHEVSIATEPKDIMREDFGVAFQVPLENGLIKNEVNLQIFVKALSQ